MAYIPFVDVGDFSKVLRIGRGAAESAGSSSGPTSWYLDSAPDAVNLFRGELDMKQSYYVKPTGFGKSITPKSVFEINLQVTSDAFHQACKKLDAFVLGAVYERKEEFLPKRAEDIESVDALKPLYSAGKIVKKGIADKDGNEYPSNLRLKIAGNWYKFATDVIPQTVIARGRKTEVIKSVVWSPRTVADHPMAANETRFLLFSHVNKDGKDVYVDRVLEKGVMRYVGPVDCQPGCRITPLFSMSQLWFNEGMGVTAIARSLYIKGPVVEHGTASSGGSSGLPLVLLDNIVVDKEPLQIGFASVTSSAAGDTEPLLHKRDRKRDREQAEEEEGLESTGGKRGRGEEYPEA